MKKDFDVILIYLACSQWFSNQHAQKPLYSIVCLESFKSVVNYLVCESLANHYQYWTMWLHSVTCEFSIALGNYLLCPSLLFQFTLIKKKANAICRLIWWGKYHQEKSSQLIIFMSRMFPVKNSNLPSYGLVAKSSVFKTSQLWSLLPSHLTFWVSFNLLFSQRLIFRLPKNLITPAPSPHS